MDSKTEQAVLSIEKEEEKLVPIEQPDEVPYDKERYRELFAKAQKEYPNVDWLFLHVAVISELMDIEI
eukprot:763106-Hanusia_phi.AAC.2